MVLVEDGGCGPLVHVEPARGAAGSAADIKGRVVEDLVSKRVLVRDARRCRREGGSKHRRATRCCGAGRAEVDEPDGEACPGLLGQYDWAQKESNEQRTVLVLRLAEIGSPCASLDLFSRHSSLTSRPGSV